MQGAGRVNDINDLDEKLLQNKLENSLTTGWLTKPTIYRNEVLTH